MSRVITSHGRFQVATQPMNLDLGFVGWAKEGEIVGANPIEELGDPVWFDFGRSRDEVTAKLLREVGALS